VITDTAKVTPLGFANLVNNFMISQSPSDCDSPKTSCVGRHSHPTLNFT